MRGLRDRRGITLMELLIASILVTLIFGGAIATYTSSLKFLDNTQRQDMAMVPEVVMEQLIKVVRIANSATVTQGTSQLNLRMDQTCPGNGGPLGIALNTPANPADDWWWHYRFTNGQLINLCDGAAGTALPAGGSAVVLINADTVNAPPGYTSGSGCNSPCTGGSGFRLVNPTGGGVDSVVFVHMRTTANPARELHTETAIGAMAKG